MAFDVVAFVAAWWAVTLVVVSVLNLRHPDNPWGNLVVAIGFGFSTGIVTLATIEASTSSTFGRAMTGLRVVDRRGPPLSRFRLRMRVAIKAALVVALVEVGFALEARFRSPVAIVMPGLAFVAVNAAICAVRGDGRSLVDLIVGSRSKIS